MIAHDSLQPASRTQPSWAEHQRRGFPAITRVMGTTNVKWRNYEHISRSDGDLVSSRLD
jgi:hypothetical protein